MVLCLAFPYDQNLPPQFLKRRQMVLITLDIFQKFRVPVPPVRSWHPPVRALRGAVLVPEAAMDKYRFPAWPKNQIGVPRKFLCMKPEPVPKPVDNRTNNNFRLCVLRPYRRHRPRADQFGNVINHLCPSPPPNNQGQACQGPSKSF